MWPFKNKFNASDIPKRHDNVAGKYFIDDNVCIAHMCCVEIAPQNIKEDTNGNAYVFKQPETAEEERQCREAVESCPVEAVRDDGEKHD